MKISRAGIIILIFITALIGANCSYYNRIIARKDLVDGANAYKSRNFAEAETLFRNAVERDPDLSTLEGKTAKLFLARTLHSSYIGNRGDKAKAEAAITEYKSYLAKEPNDQSAFKAVANLLENLERDDEWRKWITERTQNESVPAAQRAEALTSLAARENSCANDISDVEPVKQTVEKDGVAEYKFVKPEDEATFAKLKQCSEQGLQFANKAVELDPNSDSAWSYKASLLVQKTRIAEMENNPEQKEEFKNQATQAKDKFTELAEAKRKAEEAAEAKRKAEEEKANKK